MQNVSHALSNIDWSTVNIGCPIPGGARPLDSGGQRQVATSDGSYRSPRTRNERPRRN